MRRHFYRARALRSPLLPAVLSVGAIATGCQIFTGPKDPLRELDEARTVWEELGIRSYTVQQSRSCECLPPYEYTLVVEDGELVDVVYERRPHWTAVAEQFMTVDDVFDRLERVRHDESATWTASYHPEYGYPTDIFIDGHPTGVDDEVTITMSDLVVTR